MTWDDYVSERVASMARQGPRNGAEKNKLLQELTGRTDISLDFEESEAALTLMYEKNRDKDEKADAEAISRVQKLLGFDLS